MKSNMSPSSASYAEGDLCLQRPQKPSPNIAGIKYSMKIISTLLLLSFAVTAHAVDCVIMDYRTHDVGEDGITRNAQWQDKICTDANNIWRERLHVRAAAQSKHEDHPNPATATQWYRHNKDGTQLSLLWADQKKRANLSKADWDLVGFDGHWPDDKELFADTNNANGSFQQKVSSHVQMKQAPWLQLAGYQEKDWADYGD